MLKNVRATATMVSIAVLVFSSMTVSAYADDSVVSETNTMNVEEETTVAEAEKFADAITTTTETANVVDVESTMRTDYDDVTVKVGDVIFFENGVELIDAEGNILKTGKGERISIVKADCANQRFRVYVPKANKILYLEYVNCVDAQIVYHDGSVIGDLNSDGRIDIYDFILLKQGLIYGWSDVRAYYMSDINADGVVSIGDLVLMQRWLLGEG